MLVARSRGGGGVGFSAIEWIGEGPNSRESAWVRTPGELGDKQWGVHALEAVRRCAIRHGGACAGP